MSYTKLYKYRLLGVIIIALIAFSCEKTDTNEGNINPIINSMNDLQVPDDFSYNMRNTYELTVLTLDNGDNPIGNVRIDLYTDYPEAGGKKIHSFVSDKDGYFSTEIKLAAYMDSIVIGSPYLSYINHDKIALVNQQIEYIFGGSSKLQARSKSTAAVLQNPAFKYLGTYDGNGVPNYLSQNDYVGSDFLDDINASFPENRPVPQYNPEYLLDANESNLVLNDPADVWVTFVHEGAGYKNVLGFYTFTTGNPPASTADIDSITIIFPNVSFQGSGGGLQTGNKVYIGQYPANTEIGWVLIANGWNGSQVTDGNDIFYSDKHLNPENSASLKQHNVLLNDPGRDKIVLGFEDLRRDAWCDNDFNDAMFYVTANPIAAIETGNLQLIDYTAIDSDGDGISNAFDDYPNDATKAFNNYYPAENDYGSLAFEDLWPNKGDYDFNDMVIDYYFNQITDKDNKVVSIDGEIILKAVGASYKNGFGFEIPISPSLINQVTGINLQENIINLNSNNTESGQSNAVIIVFDNAYKILEYPGMATGINVDPSAPYVNPDTLNVQISFNNPVELSQTGTPPYNPFIFINKIRSHEVHLTDMPPTDLMNTALFGTGADNSNPLMERYYKTENNLPWAIDVVEKFDYPIEKNEIIQGYLRFSDWAISSGNTYYDWNKNLSNYRDASKIYSLGQ